MKALEECLFCQFVSGTSPSHKIWEDDAHLAFLANFPNTEGFSVVITKEHFASAAFDVPENVYVGLMKASRLVGKLLDEKLEFVGRTALIVEGFGVDHLHTKLFPMHGTKMAEWQPHASTVNKYFEKYEGYVSSHRGEKVDDIILAKLAKKIAS